MYKMIVTDLDGTLLKSNKSVDSQTKSLINNFRARGIKIVIATARPESSVKQFIPDVAFDAAIYNNGSILSFCQENIKVYESIACPGKAIKTLKEHGFKKIAVAAEEKLYANFDVTEIWPDTYFIKTNDFSEVSEQFCEIAFVINSYQNLKAIEELFERNIYMQISENTIGMIMSKSATKENGIIIIAEKYNIDLSEIVAFGDDYNDIQMLKLCGLGVAVGNAIPEVKNVADAVCLSNEESGFYHMLKELDKKNAF